MDAELQARARLELDLRKALAAGEFEPLYQPLVRPGDRRDHRLRGAAALAPSGARHGPARRVHSDRRGNRPDQRDRRLGAATRPARRPRAGRTDQGGGQSLADAVQEPPSGADRRAGAGPSGLPANRLELEITESLFLQDNERRSRSCIELRILGVRIALDDFGTGYSSLSYLRSSRSTRSRSIAASSATSPTRSTARRSSFGRDPRPALGMVTTAEGVETAESSSSCA